jgi:hypothetical protein
MKKLTLVLSLCLIALPIFAQTASCPAGTDVGYNYSGSATIGYNSPLGSGIAAGSGFGVKVGSCSKSLLEVAIWTGITGTAQQVGYSLATATYEYDLVKSGNAVFGGDGTIGGAQVTGTTATGLFQGGFHVGYDIGGALSKGKTSLYLLAHANYTYLTNPPVPNAVKENYWFEVRKTFK